jgi:CRISPR-associated protein Csy1
MVTQIPDPQEVAALRGLVDGFIQERLQPKLDAIKDDDADAQAKREALAKKYERQSWLQKAAKDCEYLLLATHPEKGNHSAIKDSLSIYLEKAFCDATWFVGTHLLFSSIKADVAVKNAATLYVWDFLKRSHDGKTLLQRMIHREKAALAALSDDQELASKLAEQFASIYERKREIASHTLAKQLYFPLPDDGYHLLAPLFPTALVHGVHTHLQEARFSDAAKAARTARRAKEPHAHGYCDYPAMAVRNMGGSKPQNISQLNSERGGANYLLASVPPVWKDQGTQPPLRVASVFDKRGLIGRDRTVYLIAKALRPFLESVADVDNNMHIRDKRAELVQAIIDRVLDMATELQCLNGGWSADPACKLSWAQKQWLDADALEAAQAVHETQAAAMGAADVALVAPEATEWRDKVAEDFARWLNATLSTDKIRMGDAEFVEWKHTFLEVLP